MKTHLDFVQYLPEWKIPEKYIQDKEILHTLLENTQILAKHFEQEIYLDGSADWEWIFKHSGNFIRDEHRFVCLCAEVKRLGFIKRCVKLSLNSTKSDASLELFISQHGCFSYNDVYGIGIPERMKLRAYWLRQLETKLEGML